MRLFSKIAYHSTRQKGLTQFDDTTSEDKAKTGEGAMVHGWGLYLQGDKELNIERYKESLAEDDYKDDFHIIIDGITYTGHFSFENVTYNQMHIYPTYKWTDGDDEIFRNYDYAIELISAFGRDKAIQYLREDIEDKHVAEEFNLDDGYLEKLLEWVKTVSVQYPDGYSINKYESSQYTVEIPDDMNFIDERATLNFNDPIIDKIITENNIVTSKDMQPYREELKETIYEKYPNVQYLDNIIDEYIVSGNAQAFQEFNDRNTPLDVDGTSSRDMDLAYDFISQTIYDSTFYNHSRHSTESNIELYRELARKFGGEDKASEYLADNGIDGIRYEGGTDGECWVIFNCDKLKIIKEE